MEMSESPTREIISVQLGNYSNYVGAHAFNLQNPLRAENTDVNHEVLWRRVLNHARQPTWVPRVLIFDLKENYLDHSSLYVSGPGKLDQTDSEGIKDIIKDVMWHGNVQSVDQREEEDDISSSSSSIVQSSNVKSWGDYTRWKLRKTHDESRFTLPNFSHNATSNVVSNYGQGLQIYSAMEEKVTDSLRRYAEPCDYLQGFHISVDEGDGFGGLASGLLQHIADDYDKKTSFCFGVSRPVPGRNEQFSDFKIRALNTALLWNSFNLHSSVFTSIGLSTDLSKINPKPVQLPHMIYNPESAYESSSVLAGALDTLTMPYRTRSSEITLHEVASLLNAYGHKMAVIGSSFPFPITPNSTLFESLNEHGLSMLKSLTPGLTIDAEKSVGNFFVPRGFSIQQVIRRREEHGRLRGDQDPVQGRGITNAQSCFEVYSQEACRKSVNVVRSVVTPFSLSHPFPVLFDQNYFDLTPSRVSGLASGRSIPGAESLSFPTVASAHNTTAVGELLENMITEAEPGGRRGLVTSKANLAGMANIELDDYDEAIASLRILRDSYSEEMY